MKDARQGLSPNKYAENLTSLWTKYFHPKEAVLKSKC
jgi:hypothetical protein